MELLKGGVDMQSVHAGACFVRVGRCCLGSILGSILESFGEPFGKLGHHFRVFEGIWRMVKL